MRSWRDQLVAQAEGSAKRTSWLGVGLLAAQAVTVTRLTFWEIGWDIMEPFTYMVTVTYGMLGVAFFAAKAANPEYHNVWDMLVQRRLRKLYQRHNFPEGRYKALTAQLAEARNDLRLWGETASPAVARAGGTEAAHHADASQAHATAV